VGFEMFGKMKFLVILLAVSAFAIPAAVTPAGSRPATRLTGRWRVMFIIGGLPKNLILESKANGAGSFHLLDTGPDDKPVPTPRAAAWSQTTNDRVSFSGEAEMPLGTCCREMGTLVFKGKFDSDNSISGKLLFVTSIDDDESPYKFRSMMGTFSATRVLDNS